MKNHFVKLPVTTRDGQFTARYSEKGLAELHFPLNVSAELPLGQTARQRRPTNSKIRVPHSAIRN